MEIKFHNIEERDTDFAIIRSFIENEKVRELFFKQIGRSGSIVKIYHSLMDTESDGHNGESDIVIILKDGESKFAIFIEDKIAADPQPSQRDRYTDRAEQRKDIEGYDESYIFLCAPQAYLDTEKANGYDLRVSHESIAEVLDDDSFDREVFRFSTEEKNQGYNPIRDDAVTDFWERLYDHVHKYYPDINLPVVSGPRGKAAAWPAIKTNVKGLVIRWKTDRNIIDLEFASMGETYLRREYLFALLDNLKIYEYSTEDTGKSISLRKNYSIDETVSFHEPFDNQVSQINACLNYILDFLNIAERIHRLNVKSFPLE